MLLAGGGFVSVKIRSPFGHGQRPDREVQLVGIQGQHVFVQSCDEGPQMMTLITRGSVLPESLGAFDRWVRGQVGARSRRPG
jgi:hypothetical protein